MIRWLAPSILNRTINSYIFTFVNFFTLLYIATACEDLAKFELYMYCASVRPLITTILRLVGTQTQTCLPVSQKGGWRISSPQTGVMSRPFSPDTPPFAFALEGGRQLLFFRRFEILRGSMSCWRFDMVFEGYTTAKTSSARVTSAMCWANCKHVVQVTHARILAPVQHRFC